MGREEPAASDRVASSFARSGAALRFASVDPDCQVGLSADGKGKRASVGDREGLAISRSWVDAVLIGVNVLGPISHHRQYHATTAQVTARASRTKTGARVN
jgi:hypothetical protein